MYSFTMVGPGEYFSRCVILSAQRRIYFAMGCLIHIND